MTKLQENDYRFQQLLEAVQRGWVIDEPVLLGAMWRCNSSANDSIYHFVLRNEVEDKTTLISFPSSSQLLSFLSENSIQVCALR